MDELTRLSTDCGNFRQRRKRFHVWVYERSIKLTSFVVDQTSIKYPVRLESIEQLTVSGPANISKKAIEGLVNSCLKLQQLRWIGDLGVLKGGSKSFLKKLTAVEGIVSENSVQLISTHCCNLVTLKLQYACSNDTVYIAIVRNNPQLEHVELYCSCNVLSEVGQYCKQIRHVTIDCQMTDTLNIDLTCVCEFLSNSSTVTYLSVQCEGGIVVDYSKASLELSEAIDETTMEQLVASIKCHLHTIILFGQIGEDNVATKLVERYSHSLSLIHLNVYHVSSATIALLMTQCESVQVYLDSNFDWNELTPLLAFSDKLKILHLTSMMDSSKANQLVTLFPNLQVFNGVSLKLWLMK